MPCRYLFKGVKLVLVHAWPLVPPCQGKLVLEGTRLLPTHPHSTHIHYYLRLLAVQVSILTYNTQVTAYLDQNAPNTTKKDE